MRYGIFVVVLLLSSFSVFGDPQTEIIELQKSWDQTNFTLDSKPRKKALRALIEKAGQYRQAHPEKVEFYIWEGIIRASYNDAAGGIGGLRQAKEAKELFEKAIKINPDAMHGMAYTALGTLYYQVIGWPISFGDDQKAEEFLNKGISTNPNDLEAHYFLGKLYMDDDNWKSAVEILEKGLALPEISELPAFDHARRIDMERLLAKAKSELADQ
jgi:tetratricopeptide (TPR) repeat protein